MRKLELTIAIVMLICTIGSFVSLFFCTEDFELMMTTIVFIFSATVGAGVLAASSYSASKY
jgi:hypothetical protein